MRVAVLFSGGKDSTFSTFLVKRQKWEVKYLVTIEPISSESWMFHHPLIKLTKLQAEAMGIEHIIKKTEGKKEEELEDLIAALQPIKDDVDAIVSGAVASNYQKDRIEAICKELGLKSVTPLWHKDPEQLLRQQLESGFEIIFSGVASAGFDKKWLGRKVDSEAIEELKALNDKHGVNIAGEGGEYESFVLDCPLFKRRIELDNINRVWDEKTISGHITADGRLVDK